MSQRSSTEMLAAALRPRDACLAHRDGGTGTLAAILSLAVARDAGRIAQG
jgi:hypothetical protein